METGCTVWRERCHAVPVLKRDDLVKYVVAYFKHVSEYVPRGAVHVLVAARGPGPKSVWLKCARAISAK